MALRYEGCETQAAGDGLTTVRAARTFRPDAVVLDMMLPDMDGLEVLRKLRGEAPEVSVLFHTAKDTDGASVSSRVATGCCRRSLDSPMG